MPQHTIDVKRPSFCAFAESVAHAQNKHHISIFNPADSTYIIRLRKLFLTNMQLVAVTGVAERFDLRRISALSGGTDLTVNAHDTGFTALPSGLLVKTGGTCTDAGINCSLSFNNDEVGATGIAYDYQHMNWLPEADGLEYPTLRAGQGFTVQQITASTIGSFGWLLVFTAEKVRS